ncbi:MAG TPA: hypothetical protein VFL57_09445 [Bryobacteraceae bacterium]|nr:hypothetical protein [Bryobacteraceae bacterium]
MRRRIRAVFLCFCIHAANAAILETYISGPGVQTSFVWGGITETFDSLAARILNAEYGSTIGTYELTPGSSVLMQSLAADVAEPASAGLALIGLSVLLGGIRQRRSRTR